VIFIFTTISHPVISHPSSFGRLIYYQLTPQVKNVGSELKTIPHLMSDKQIDEGQEYNEAAAYRNISLRMHTSNTATWWEVLEICNDSLYKNLFEKLPHADCTNNLVLYTFSDKLFPETLSIFTAGG